MRLTESKVYIGVIGYLATKEGQFLTKGGGDETGFAQATETTIDTTD